MASEEASTVICTLNQIGFDFFDKILRSALFSIFHQFLAFSQKTGFYPKSPENRDFTHPGANREEVQWLVVPTSTPSQLPKPRCREGFVVMPMFVPVMCHFIR